MKLLDVNLLIYAVNQDAPHHATAKKWLETAMSGTETILLPWAVLLAFVRLSTRPGLFRRPLPTKTSLDLVEAWLDRPNVSLIEPGPNHLRILREILAAVGTGGNLTSDAHLAALAIESGAELCSTDSDFARFPRVRWTNPVR